MSGESYYLHLYDAQINGLLVLLVCSIRVGGEGRGTPSRYRVMLAGLNLLYPSGNEVYLSVASITKVNDALESQFHVKGLQINTVV